MTMAFAGACDPIHFPALTSGGGRLAADSGFTLSRPILSWSASPTSTTAPTPTPASHWGPRVGVARRHNEPAGVSQAGPAHAIRAATIANNNQHTNEASSCNARWVLNGAIGNPRIQYQALMVRPADTGNQIAPTKRGLVLARAPSALTPRHAYRHARGATGKKNRISKFQGQSR